MDIDVQSGILEPGMADRSPHLLTDLVQEGGAEVV